MLVKKFCDPSDSHSHNIEAKRWKSLISGGGPFFGTMKINTPAGGL
jgi:hypothetical protein